MSTRRDFLKELTAAGLATAAAPIVTRAENANLSESAFDMGKQCKDVSGQDKPVFISPWIDGKKAVDAAAWLCG